MTPTITATYAAVVAIMYVGMSAYVIKTRAQTNVLLGDGANPTMLLAMRRHGNMSEYAPFALLIMGLAEMLGTGALWLHLSGSALILGRLFHAHGLQIGDGVVATRVIGTLATFAAIVVPAGAILLITLA